MSAAANIVRELRMTPWEVEFTLHRIRLSDSYVFGEDNSDDALFARLASTLIPDIRQRDEFRQKLLTIANANV